MLVIPGTRYPCARACLMQTSKFGASHFQPVSGQKTRVESVLCIPGFARFLNGPCTMR